MPHNGGLTQVNPWFAYNAGDYSFLNRLKQAADWEVRDNSGAKDPSKHDANGWCHTIYNTGVYARTHIPSASDRPGNWVLKWTGGGTLSATGLSAQTATDGRFAFAPGAQVVDIHITGVTTPGSDYPHDIIFCHEDDEAQVALQPYGFTELVKTKNSKTGVWRCLDWQQSNVANVVRWADRLPTTHWSFTAPKYPIELYAGTTTNSGDDYSATLSGFALVDKAQVIVNFNADSTGTTPTLEVSGTGVKTIRNEYGGELSSSRRPKSGRVGTLTYDLDLDCWLKLGGDTNVFSQGISSGVPIEAILLFCDEIGAHPWVLSPYLTVDPMSDWTVEQATAIKTYSDASATWMIPRYEPPNESWNNQFRVTQYGYLKEGVRVGSPTFDIHNWYGRVLSKIGKVISTLYADDRTKYQVICGVQAYGSTAGSNARLTSASYVAETGDAGDAAKFWATHVAPAIYWSSSFDGTTTDDTMAAEYATATDARKTELIEEYLTSDEGTNAVSWADTIARIDAWNTWRNSFGVTMGFTSYEGGYATAGYLPGSAELDAFQRAAYFSSTLYWLTQRQYKYILSLGGEFPSAYVFSGVNEWALFNPNIYATPSTAYDAAVDFSNNRLKLRLRVLA